MKARSQSSSTPKKRSEASQESWTSNRALAELRRLGERRNVEGMARFGIVAKNVLGVAKPRMDELARKIGRDHRLALELWETGVHDARILAGMIDESEQVTTAQMNRWVRDFDNWDVCDGTCCHLFAFAAPAWDRAIARWCGECEQMAASAVANIPIVEIADPPIHLGRGDLFWFVDHACQDSAIVHACFPKFKSQTMVSS